MKKILTAFVVALLFASCAKVQDTFDDPTDNRSAVTVTFVAEPNQNLTRAFFDPALTTETWEKELHSLVILTFDASGNLLIRRNFTSSELAAKKATFALPRSAAGVTCSFYAVANRALPEIKRVDELINTLETEPESYNSTFTEVTAKAIRSGGFVMSGMLTKKVGSVNTVTDVPIMLKRVVAKIAVQTTLSADFSTRYPGTVRIDNTTISRACANTNLFAGETATQSDTPFSYTQAVIQPEAENSSVFNNLFYIYENGALAAGNRVLLTLEGIYDRDGNFSTTGDQLPISYACEISGSASNGTIQRNGYYRVAVGISGLMGQDINAIVTVADWESPISQTINLGQ